VTIRLLEVSLGSGQKVIVETEDSRASSGAVAGGATIKLKQSFTEIVEQMAGLIEPLHESITRRAANADELKVEFGFKLSADVGVVIAKTQSEGNFSVTLTWKKDVSKMGTAADT
jgi:hypothetical protein